MKFSLSTKLNLELIALFIALIFAPNFAVAAPSKTLVIDQFQVAGADTHDEFVSILNVGGTSVDLSGYRLVKRVSKTTEYPLIKDFGSYQLEPGKRVVAGHTEYTGTKDFTFFVGSTSTLTDNNAIYLYNGTTLVDLVGYGDATFSEGMPVSTPAAGDIYMRTGGMDTENNVVDFSLLEIPILVDPNVGRLVITELYPNPDTGEQEWFELFNPTNLDISLANLKICDALGSRHCYFFDVAESIVAQSYRVFEQSTTKITLNNDGDWLELYDVADNLLTDSGGDYGSAEKGLSLAVFGTDYLWTKTPTPGVQNIYTDTVEVEADTAALAPKVTKSKVVTKKTASVVTTKTEADPTAEVTNNEVLAAEKTAGNALAAGSMSNRKMLGWALIALAILLVLGYTLWYFRSYAKDIYDKIKHRDDSARF